MSALYASLCDLARARDERNEAWADRTPDDDLRDELRQEAAAEHRANARLRHWCDVCHGHTGPGSPCYDGPEDEEDEEPAEEEDSPFCQGCNPQVTQDERDRGRCACCGKELL